MKTTIASALLALVLFAGCSTEMHLGDDRRDGSVGPDASRPHARTDECGNGIDDDGNGRIDDGCPCGPGETQACFMGASSSRHVGACTDGVQTCPITGSTEWGDWGGAPCVGGTTPATEQCDGMDHDCDGARDEDCPCAAGMMQTCGLEFLTAPCRGGAQTCRADGTWSGCDGAIGPTPDVCLASGAGDGINQDCDGTTDEGCGCVPEPERCRDGLDNDCDGEVDEPACTPDWPPADAGVRGDAGSVDGGAPVPPTCDPPAAPRCYTRSGGISDLGVLTGPIDWPTAAGTADELALVGPGFFARADATGTLIDSRPLALRSPALDEYVQLVDTGSEYVLAWSPDEGSSRLQRLSRTGDLIGAPVVIDIGGPRVERVFISWVGDTLLVIIGSGTAFGGPPWIQRFDATLSPRGPARPIDLTVVAPDSTVVFPQSIAATDPDHFLSSQSRTFSSPAGTMLWPRPLVLATSGTTAVSTFDPLARDGQQASEVRMAATCGRVLAWWQSYTDRFDPFPAGGARQAMEPRMAVLDPSGAVVSPIVAPVGERFGIQQSTVVPLGPDGFFVLERTDASVFERDGNIAVIVRVALDGTVLQRTEVAEEGWATYSIPTAARVGDCVMVVRPARRYGDASSDTHMLVTRYCPSAC